jgi:hypothetical protein
MPTELKSDKGEVLLVLSNADRLESGLVAGNDALDIARAYCRLREVRHCPAARR